MKNYRLIKKLLLIFSTVILCGIIAILLAMQMSNVDKSHYSVAEINVTNNYANEMTVLIYRNGKNEFFQTFDSSVALDTDIYCKYGDTIRIVSSSGVSNFDLNTEIQISESKFPKNTYQIVITDETGIVACLDFHIVREKPKLFVDNKQYDYNTTLYFNTDKTISWGHDAIISNPKNSGINIKSTGNKTINEEIKFSSITKSFVLSTAEGSETSYIVKAIDAADNEIILNIIIDKQAPIGKIISDGKQLSNNRAINKPTFVEFDEEGVTAQFAINNGLYKPYSSGQIFTIDGKYSVLLTDKVGNTKLYTFTIDTIPPIGQLYADYQPVKNNTITRGIVYLTWDDNYRVTVNGKPYRKNSVITDDGDYVFAMIDMAGNSTTYNIRIDTVCPNFNVQKLINDKSYLISKWHNVNIDGSLYSFATYEEALTFAANKEFASGVTTLNLENMEDFKQFHLVASNGNPDNHADEVRVGEYWLYKSKANPNILLYYFDRDLLDNVIAFYAKNTVSKINYFVLDSDNPYGTPSESMCDNLLTAIDGTLAPAGNNFVFERRDSMEIYAELVDSDRARVNVAYDIPFCQQFSVNGLYRITEIDAAKNETVYFLYLDTLAPELLVNATIYGSDIATELMISEESLASIAAYYYMSFDIRSIADVDKWSMLAIENNGKVKYFSFNDDMPMLNIGGEYMLSLYDRLGNTYSFMVYIVGNPAEIEFQNNGDDTAFNITITLEQDFNTIVNLEIRRNDIVLDGVFTDTLTYVFDRTGSYTVILRDNFGRVIERKYIFVKSLPVGMLSGVVNGGKCKNDVTFTYDAKKYYAVIYKEEAKFFTDRSGSVLILANDENSGTYVIRLYNLTDEENYKEYGFIINTLAPEVTLSGVANNGTTNGDVSVYWKINNVDSSIYTLNSSETQTLTNGQKLTAEGSYFVTVTNDLGTITTLNFTIDKTLEYSITIGEETVGNVETTNKTVSIINDEPLYISIKMNGEQMDYAFGNLLSDEGIYGVRISDDYGNSVNFTITIDKSVSYSANIANGLISNGGVTFINNEILTIATTHDGNVFDYSFGQTLDDEGEYNMTLSDVYGNEKRITFRIVKGVKQSIEYSLGDGASVLSITRNGEIYPLNGKNLKFTEDGEYVITTESEGFSCSFTLTLDTTAPTITLNGIKNGGVADGIVTITEPNEEVIVNVYKNGELIDYELGQELSDYAEYQVIVTDSAGNISEYSFTLKHLLNGGSVALIVIGILVGIGIVITIIFLRKKGKFSIRKKFENQA